MTASLTALHRAPAPKFATRRTLGCPSFGPRVAAVGDFLGTPFMPWQRLVADVASEVDPTRPGAWRYPLVVVTVPRQAGKTALLRAILVDRMLCYQNHGILMTAQTGKDARKRWNQIVAALSAEKNPERFKVRSSSGSERLEYLASHSYISPFAPTPKSIHGDSLPLVAVDEAWAFDAEAGAALEAAINPTQLTVLDSQIWIVSTKGTLNSTYLNDLLKKGRKSLRDPNASMAFFEWSADEDAAARDPYSDETLSFHPAIGYTQTPEKIRALATDGETGNWFRSILNLQTATAKTVVDMAIWDGLADAAPRTPPADLSSVWIGYDVARDRSTASIAAAWKDDDGLHTTILKTQPGVGWLISDLQSLAHVGYGGLIADDGGPTRTVSADLLAADTDAVQVMRSRDYGSASQLLLDRIAEGEITHDGNPDLRAALAGSVLRPMGGAVAFDPVHSAGAIDTLRATTAAVWAASRVEPTGPLVF